VAVLELRGSVSFPLQADHPLLEINHLFDATTEPLPPTRLLATKRSLLRTVSSNLWSGFFLSRGVCFLESALPWESQCSTEQIDAFVQDRRKTLLGQISATTLYLRSAKAT